MDMVEAHGLWWPKGSESYVRRYVRHAHDLAVAVQHCKGKRVAVQAGGHCGAWPLWLSRRFDRVYTWEPDGMNFACLMRNVAKESPERIYAARGMLGSFGSTLSLNRNQVNIGGHKGTPDRGPVPVYQIDALDLQDCDLVQLDVEGMELPALSGAVVTLTKHRPVLMIEDRDHGARHGWGTRERLMEFLAGIGYREVARISHDMVLTCA